MLLGNSGKGADIAHDGKAGQQRPGDRQFVAVERSATKKRSLYEAR